MYELTFSSPRAKGVRKHFCNVVFVVFVSRWQTRFKKNIARDATLALLSNDL